MRSYTHSIELLYSLEKYGLKFGLEGISKLLDPLGNPHFRFPSIHIAGTNGKGSTASMIAAIFTAAGYRTGLYTSPHLVSLRERIRIDGKPIPERDVAEVTSRLERSIRGQQPTFFEATTALGFAWLAEKGVDIAIIETGLGGRLDSTNVVRPIVSVITTIGLEHTEILGNTLEKIALEKAGIIKKRVPCVTGVDDRKSLGMIRRACKQQSAPLVTLKSLDATIRHESLKGSVFDLLVGKSRHKNLKISLAGRFQIRNAALAIATIEQVNKSAKFQLSERSMRSGLSKIQELAGLTGRLDLIQQKPPVILDVAHNADGVTQLVAALRHLGIENLIIVFGVMKDKDHVAMVRSLEPIAVEVIAVAAQTERSRSASDVAALFTKRDLRVSAALSVSEGVRLAIQRGSQRMPILVTGSHYVVGEALQYLAAKKNLTITR